MQPGVFLLLGQLLGLGQCCCCDKAEDEGEEKREGEGMTAKGWGVEGGEEGECRRRGCKAGEGRRPWPLEGMGLRGAFRHPKLVICS